MGKLALFRVCGGDIKTQVRSCLEEVMMRGGHNAWGSLLLPGGCVTETFICFGLCPFYINEAATSIFTEMFQIYSH